MWKKLRNSSLGLKVHFVKNAIQRRQYNKFDSDENLCRKQDGGNEIFVSQDLHGPQDVKTAGHADVSRTNSQIEEASHYFDQYSGEYETGNNVINHSTSYEDNSKVEIVRDDLRYLVNGRLQSRYNRLDGQLPHNSSFEDDYFRFNRRHSEISQDAFSDSCHEDDNRNRVFNCAKDVHPELNKKKKSKKKKVAKRVRRGVRVSWKYLKRGFAGFAAGMQYPVLTSAIYNIYRPYNQKS